jgi:hypothetical protein
MAEARRPDTGLAPAADAMGKPPLASGSRYANAGTLRTTVALEHSCLAPPVPDISQRNALTD